MEKLFDIPVLSFANESAWEEWLKINHSDPTGVWLKIAKKDSQYITVNYTDALHLCLCYGWIDGQRRGYDSDFFLQKYTPRRKRSLWSKVNIAKVEALIEAGRMQAPGLVEIENAKADGRWEAAYDSQRTAIIPPDLSAEFEKHPLAKDFYDSLTKAEKYSVLWQLMTARSDEMRSSRLEKVIGKLSRQEKI